MPKYIHHRFKVQRRVELQARDTGNRPFLLGVIWRTVSEADHQAVAESLLDKQQSDNRESEFRIAEEWPEGTLPRPIFRARARRKKPKRDILRVTSV
jgi:hypothetical protein